jgi:hypothetical protein
MGMGGEGLGSGERNGPNNVCTYEYMSYKSVIEGMNVVKTLDACMKEVQ